MSNSFANVLAGTSVLIEDDLNHGLREMSFISGKPGLQDLIVFLGLRGWNADSPLLFMAVDPEDKIFLAASDHETLAIMSKELCELFQGNFDCTFLTYKEMEEFSAQAE